LERLGEGFTHDFFQVVGGFWGGGVGVVVWGGVVLLKRKPEASSLIDGVKVPWKGIICKRSIYAFHNSRAERNAGWRSRGVVPGGE